MTRRRRFTHEQAVANTRILLTAARDAGVKRIVHVSITHPDSTSDLPYFRGKAELESSLMGLGLSYCILRPTVLFGKEFGYWSCRLLGLFVGDVIITREEIRGLMEGRLHVDAPPLGTTRMTDWMARHRDTLGHRYTSEMARRVDRASSYRTS